MYEVIYWRELITTQWDWRWWVSAAVRLKSLSSSTHLRPMIEHEQLISDEQQNRTCNHIFK